MEISIDITVLAIQRKDLSIMYFNVLVTVFIFFFFIL